MADPIQDAAIVPPLAVPPLHDSGDEERLKQECARKTPSNARLRELAKKSPPPPEYFEGDEQIPFDPIEE